MSGHSKWSTIKRQKQTEDIKKGKLFSKLARAIAVAAREGPDPEKNYKLRLVIEKAKAVNMPKDNIERAIKRGVSGKRGEGIQEVVYEGYGPAGVGIMVEAVTDNRQRTTAAIKNILEKAGGSLGEPGSVAFMFKSQGVITVPLEGRDPEEVMLAVIDAGAEDVDKAGTMVVVYTKPEALDQVKNNLLKAGFKVETAELNLEPTSVVKIEKMELAKKILALIDRLEEAEDTQKVYATFDIPGEILEKIKI